MSEEKDTTIVDPEPGTDGDGSPSNTEPTADVTELQEQLAAAQRERDAALQAKTSAEKAIELEKKEHSKTKRNLAEKESATMTEAEKLKVELEAAEAEKAEYAIKRNAVDAEKLFVGAGIPEATYKTLLDDFVTPDADKTEAIAKGIVAMIESQVKDAKAAEREAVLKEMPEPPGGNGGEPDFFLAGFEDE